MISYKETIEYCKNNPNTPRENAYLLLKLGNYKKAKLNYFGEDQGSVHVWLLKKQKMFIGEFHNCGNVEIFCDEFRFKIDQIQYRNILNAYGIK